MADEITVGLEGGDELLRKLRRLGVEVEDVLELAATAGGVVFADAADTRAPEPVIEVETTEKKKGYVTVDIGPPKEKWYWQFLETGAQPHEIAGSPLMFRGRSGWVRTGRVRHTGMAAQPFLRPAFDERQKQAESALGDKLKGAIRRVT